MFGEEGVVQETLLRREDLFGVEYLQLVDVDHCQGVYDLPLLYWDCRFGQSVFDCVHVVEALFVLGLDSVLLDDGTERSP